jgi:hypothetical protein
MAFHYEVVIDQPIGELFRRKFLMNVGKMKCCEMFKLMYPGTPNLWEFKTGKEIFTLSFSEEAGDQKERISIDSMTLDLKNTVISTIKDSLNDYLLNFLSPLTAIPGPEFEKRIETFTGKLESELLSGMSVNQT